MPSRAQQQRCEKSAVLYARVSSKDQEREGFSIPSQPQLLEDMESAEI